MVEFFFLLLVCAFIFWVLGSTKPQIPRQQYGFRYDPATGQTINTETGEAKTRSVEQMTAGKERAAKRAANKKAKQLEETKEWDSYTPQKYYDEVVDKIDSSNSKEVEDVLNNLRFTSFETPWIAVDTVLIFDDSVLERKFPSNLDKFTYSYFDKFPLFYLENKANELGLKVPKKFKKNKRKSRNEVKKDKIIELLAKAEWRIQTKEEKQDVSHGSISEVKVNLVGGLDDFKLERTDLIIKKLRHKNRRVRRAAAFALPRDVVLQNLEDMELYKFALQDSLQNLVRDISHDNPGLLNPEPWAIQSYHHKMLSPSVIISKLTPRIMERLDKLDEADWESAMKVKKGFEDDDTKIQIQLVKAKGLFDEGLIDKDEYKKMKKDILDG